MRIHACLACAASLAIGSAGLAQSQVNGPSAPSAVLGPIVPTAGPSLPKTAPSPLPVLTTSGFADERTGTFTAGNTTPNPILPPAAAMAGQSDAPLTVEALGKKVEV